MKRQVITLVLFIIFSTSCEVKNQDNSIEKFITSSIITDENNIPLDSNQLYFPVKLFRDATVKINYDTFTVSWYSKHLRALKEPLLFNRKENKEVYRFIWLRSFDNPVVIRIEKANDKFKLIWKLCDGAGGYEPGNMTIFDEKVINKNAWNQFIHLAEKTRFWEMETVEKELTGLDGEQWILEGKDENRYHVVDRCSPESGDYFNCCSFLIKAISIDSSKLKKVVFKVDSIKRTDYGIVYKIYDERPNFGETNEDFQNYINSNLQNYLPSNLDCLEVNVILSIVVFEDGSAHDIRILRGMRKDIDDACIKLIANMPKWKPGKLKGKIVKTEIAIMI